MIKDLVMLDLRSNKKVDSGWVRIVLFRGVILATLYGNLETEKKLKIKYSDYIFAIIDKELRDLVEKKPKEFFILDFGQTK